MIFKRKNPPKPEPEVVTDELIPVDAKEIDVFTVMESYQSYMLGFGHPYQMNNVLCYTNTSSEAFAYIKDTPANDKVNEREHRTHYHRCVEQKTVWELPDGTRIESLPKVKVLKMHGAKP